jgi:hypothetical protein
MDWIVTVVKATPAAGQEPRFQRQQDAGTQLPERKEAEDPGREQDDLHGVGVLADERVPATLCPARGQPLRPNRPVRAAASLS